MLRQRRRLLSSDAGTVIELSIPLQYAVSTSEAAAAATAQTATAPPDEACYICAENFCNNADCCRSLTHLTCCTQPICCGCMVKTAKRCTCREDCDQVIAYCPFCRMISPCDALDLFRGACLKPCRECADSSDAAAAPAAANPPPALSTALSAAASTDSSMEDLEN